MILRILLITCSVLLSPTIAIKDLGEFFEKYYEICFKNDENSPFRLNGQETPLSNTMDNFISMAEKLEAANPNLDLKDELHYLITEYLFENIQITGGSVSEIPLGRVKLDLIKSLIDYDSYRPDIVDPLSDPEKCSLYFMISHSIVAKDTDLMRSYVNESIFPKTELDADDFFPQELGVVALRGTPGPISVSKVLLGLYIGLKPDRKVPLRTYNLNFKNVTPELLDKEVDALYATTMADVLMMSMYEGFDRKGLAKNGEWLSIPLNGERIDGFCPMVYKHGAVESIKQLPAYSYASVRGAADGLILGLAVTKIYSTEAKLSHILRMYYSPRGITVSDNIDDINNHHVSFCKRDSLIQILEENVQTQMKLYGYLVAMLEVDINNSYEKAIASYVNNKNAIYNNGGNGYCIQATSLDKPEDLDAETFLDIIVVMDSSSSLKNFVDQQMITGYLAKQLDLRYYGSRMTVLLDHKINSGTGAASRIELKPAVNNTYSSSCAACTVGQLNYEPSTVPREDVIIAVDQLLQEMKENETAFNGINGKVVIYFNYENGDGRTNNNRVQEKVEKALRDLNLRHQDVLLYAVGLDSELLKKYARDDPSLVFLGTDDKPQQVADKIFKKISYAPTLLQYSDCKDARNEKSATYETFVSPNKIQHYTMPAEYFYKSFNAKVLFESQDGQIRVCFNRATMRPELETKYCKDTAQGTAAEFKLSNPCKSFTKESCSPMYFAVMGKDPLAENNGNQPQKQRSLCKANDRMCSTLDQIKFRVSHDGIRCSGCLGLGAPPAVILFTVLLTYFLYKRF